MWFLKSWMLAVVVCVAFSVGVGTETAFAQRSTDSAAARLNRSMLSALERDDLPEALRLGHELAELRPKASLPAYNLACVYALDGKTTESVAWLTKSAERGFYFIATGTRDADLDSIRGEPGFAKAMAIIRRNSDVALEKIKPAVARARLLKRLPPGYDASKPAPLIVTLHPYGGRAEVIADVWTKLAAERGAILVAPQSLNPLAGGFDWGVIEHAEYIILQAIERARREHKIDNDRIVLTGFSQGASMSFTVALRHPGLIAGVIPVAGFPRAAAHADSRDAAAEVSTFFYHERREG